MSKPPYLCNCGKKVDHGTRCSCQITATRERNARHDAKRPSARERGYNHEWRKTRAEYLTKHPHCRMCAKSGLIRLATVVDHITPHRGDKRLFWSRSNWQPLCAPCHNSTKQRQERSL
jgi:5-methylcytosine-specific restriction endonuclease McrA